MLGSNVSVGQCLTENQLFDESVEDLAYVAGLSKRRSTFAGESLWAKPWLWLRWNWKAAEWGATHQGKVGKVHLQRYLDEFTFRFNLRSGTRELCRMVPAVGEVWRRQALQNIVPRPVVQPFVAEQFGQTNPVGQRTPIKYSQQACWLANRSVNSTRCFGKSSLNCPDLRRQRRESKDSLVHH